jgi:hypothetical protein
LFLLLRTQYGHAFQIPREANQRPFTGNLLQAAQGELVKAQYGFDDAEHGFDGLLAQGIERPASFCFGSVFETRWF